MQSITARPNGITLIEVVTALLLLASAVIGVAAIYAQQQNIARGSREHELAITLAREIAAHIRTGNEKDNYETALGVNCNSKLGKSNPSANLVACWQDKVQDELTDGSARISLDRSTVPPQYVIVVSWSEPRTGTASYVLRVSANTLTTNELKNSGAVRAAG